jgi:glycerol uptake facilitator-like aquaporin
MWWLIYFLVGLVAAFILKKKKKDKHMLLTWLYIVIAWPLALLLLIEF